MFKSGAPSVEINGINIINGLFVNQFENKGSQGEEQIKNVR